MSNSANNKRIAKNTLFLYFRSIFLILITLYTSRVILQSLGISDFGIYNVVGGVVAMFSMLSGSLQTATQRFLTFALGKSEFSNLKKVFMTSITIHITLGAILVMLLEVVGVWFLYNKMNIPAERVDVAFWVLQFSIATFFVNVISVPYNAAIIAHEKMKTFAYISILDGICKLAIAYVIAYTPFDRLIFYAMLMFGLSLLNRVIYTIYSHRHFEETQKIKFGIEKDLFREMFSFAGWNLFGSGSRLLRNQGVDILLNMFFGVTINAAKGLSNQVHHAVYQFITNFQTAVNPQLTMSVAQTDFKRTHTLIIQGGRFSFYLMCLMSVPLIIVTPQVLSIWLVEVPAFTVDFVRWTLVYLLWDTLSRFLINAVVGGTKLLILPLVYVWLKMGGSPMVGIWANILLEMVCLGQRLYFNHCYNGLSWLSYFWKVIVRCWIVFCVALAGAYYIQSILPEYFIIQLMEAIVITFTVIALVGMGKDERILVVSKVLSLIHKLRR